MHSLKHTVIAVILLGVSFGLYQVSLTPSKEGSISGGPLNSDGGRSEISVNAGTSLIQPSQLSTDVSASKEITANAANAADASQLRTGLVTTPSTPNTISVPSPPALSSTTVPVSQTPPGYSNLSAAALQLPKQSNESRINPNASGAESKPVEASIANGVQSIHYPDPAMPKSTSGSQLVQREPLKEPGDQGLVEALKTQNITPPSNAGSASVGQDFVATVPRSNSLAPKTDFVSTTPPLSTPPLSTPPLSTPPLSTPPLSTPPPSTPSLTTPAMKTSSLTTPPATAPAVANPSASNSIATSPSMTTKPLTTPPPDGAKTTQSDFVPVDEFTRPAPLASPTQKEPPPARPVSTVTPSNPVSKPPASGSTILATKMSTNEMAQFTYKTVWPKVDELVAAEDYHSALKLLSRFYKDETLNGPQRQRLLGWLDALAGKVIFSTEDHLTGKPYTIQAQETLSEVAKRWQIPVQLISNIQGESFANREVVPAGTRLKEVPGPFRAELKLKARVITLYLGDLYAGRFPVVIGTSGEPIPGKYDIVLKSENGYSWYDEQGKEYPPSSVENGYGPHWIGLSGSLCIHAVADNTTEGHRGCIGLSRQGAADLFSILSETSTLTIVP